MVSFDRIHEPDLVVPTLQFLASRPDGFATTSEIIKHLEEKFDPEGEDAEILEGRGDTRFSQIVRNMISHREGGSSFIRNSYAEYFKDKRGLQITDKGVEFLKEIGGV